MNEQNETLINTNIKVCLKSMIDFLQDEEKNSIETNFFIDAYQRGYRWTKNEVRALLEDIKEFSQSDYLGHNGEHDRFYCLQPIIVTLSNGKWKVIDGQQRLTTIFLIYTFYINIFSNAWCKVNYPFKLFYKNKEILEECMEKLSSIKDEKDFSRFKDSEKSYLKDIDCYFLVNAYEEIFSFFLELKTSKREHFISDMKKVFDNYMKLIWYEIINCNEEDEIKIFTKVNIGKIPLTNSELIKALLLKDAKTNELDSMQKSISIKWDDIEANLLDDTFWLFLVNDGDNYSTRIDFIFDVLAEDINKNEFVNTDYEVKKEYNKNYFSFYVINNYFKKMKNENKSDDETIEKIWTEICEYYRMFKDWFKFKTWYHLIGFIIYNSKTKNISKIFELTNIYRNQNYKEKGHKTFFEHELKRMCREIIEKILSGKFELEELRNKISNLSYGSDSENIKKILLCYNLAILEVEEKQTNVRFSFYEFKNKNDWDLEHINAVADGIPSDESDTDENKCKKRLEVAKKLPEIEKIKTLDGEEIELLIDKALNEKLYLTKNNNSIFIKIYETIIGYFNDLKESNSIDNLTLLDSGINRSYKNYVFPIKRKIIIEKCCSEKYIPLGTKKVFLKAYADANSLLKWTQEDCDNYFEDIINKLYQYLSSEEIL